MSGLVRSRPAALAAACMLAFGACGGDEPTGSASSSSTRAESTSSTQAAPSASGKVSANSASQEELTRAIESAGVDNAERWAHEVEEYRPYPSDDPDLAKLRGELAKYNPGPGVVDKIVSVLEP